MTYRVGLPVAVLGLIGIYLLVGPVDEPNQKGINFFLGIGALGLLGAYLALMLRTRGALTRRTTGIPLAAVALAGAVTVAWILNQADRISAVDVVVLFASAVMGATGLWLAFTGHREVKNVD